MAIDIRRRDFIFTLGGGTTAWPLAARAQQANRMRRIGVLLTTSETDQEGQARVAALRRGLEELAWTEGWGSHVIRSKLPGPVPSRC
jgi:putative tryptophan/tyrosine transport system substrate-binding protein